MVSNTGSVNGFHIEYILSVNANNLAKYNNDNDRFERERNLLVVCFYLKGKIIFRVVRKNIPIN